MGAYPQARLCHPQHRLTCVPASPTEPNAQPGGCAQGGGCQNGPSQVAVTCNEEELTRGRRHSPPPPASNFGGSRGSQGLKAGQTGPGRRGGFPRLCFGTFPTGGVEPAVFSRRRSDPCWGKIALIAAQRTNGEQRLEAGEAPPGRRTWQDSRGKTGRLTRASEGPDLTVERQHQQMALAPKTRLTAVTRTGMRELESVVDTLL